MSQLLKWIGRNCKNISLIRLFAVNKNTKKNKYINAITNVAARGNIIININSVIKINIDNFFTGGNILP